MSYLQIGKTNTIKYYKNKVEFEKTFKVPLNDFFKIKEMPGMILGFDIIKFDEWLKVPEGTSTREFLIKNYGQRASDLISELL